MNPSDTQALSVVVEREFAHPPEKLWRALTQPHLIEAWLLQNDFKPVVGHSFNLRVNPKPDVNFVLDCEVLAVEPLRKLSYTWNLRDAANRVDTIVTFTLEATAAGTRLRMEQSGFRHDQPQNYNGARSGWHRFLTNLENLLPRVD